MRQLFIRAAMATILIVVFVPVATLLFPAMLIGLIFDICFKMPVGEKK